jgi:hypothetical protein
LIAFLGSIERPVRVTMSDLQKASEAAPPASAVADCLGGASLGILLGLLIGLSITPVVSIVITALVALLAGLFGLLDKAPLQMSAVGVRRLAAFGFASALFTLVGIWVFLLQKRALFLELGHSMMIYLLHYNCVSRPAAKHSVVTVSFNI